MSILIPPQVFTDLSDDHQLQVLNDFLREVARRSPANRDGDLTRPVVTGAALSGTTTIGAGATILLQLLLERQPSVRLRVR